MKNKNLSKRNISTWKIVVNKNVDKFKKELWRDVPGDKKLKYTWDMVVEAMYLKGTPDRLKFKKVFEIRKKDPRRPM